MIYNRLQNQELSNEELLKVAPSIFATEPYHKVTSQYKFIPTVNVIEALRKNNFLPVKASQSKCRITGKKEFTKHLIRFRRREDLFNTSPEIPEIVLINSHDRTSSYQLMLGLFRLACANGLIVGETFSKIKAIHRGSNNIPQNVIDASYEIIHNTPNILNQVNLWKNISLNKEERLAYATSALALSPTTLDITPERLLSYRRIEDRPDENGLKSLWLTFNSVQENYIKGGIYGKSNNGKYRRTKRITSIDKDTKLNKALWTLTEEMAKLKR
jgi:hypothetical protein